jgi:hypothetical protein
MIRTPQNSGNAPRRIAVIRLPQSGRARLGVIRGNELPSPGGPWATLTDQTPDTSQSWLATVLIKQDEAVANTPGTLTYTPASVTPPQNVAPWNSWVSPNCPAPNQPPPVTAAPLSPAAAPTKVNLFHIMAGLGAAASAMYLFETIRRKR